VVRTYGITRFKYVLIKHTDVPEYCVFAVKSEDHLMAWYQDEDLDVIEVSEDASDRERWRLERIGEALAEMIPIENIMES
jgi:hypothetical protein